MKQLLIRADDLGYSEGVNCGSSNQNDVGKYSALLAADLLVMHYLRQYGREAF